MSTHKRSGRAGGSSLGRAFIVSAVICALTLLSANAKELVPFKGSMTLQVVDSSTTDGITEQVLEGSGIASHMGVISVRVDISIQDIGPIEGPDGQWYWLAHFWGTELETAANQDEVYSHLEGSYLVPLYPTDSFIAYIFGERHLTGGTGRFRGAQGSTSIEGTDTTVISIREEGLLSSVGSKVK